MVASNWEIGPVIDGLNYSTGMPLHPTQTAEGWAFDFPLNTRDGGSVHYITFPYGSLAGKTHIIMKYRIEADQGVEFLPPCCPFSPSIGPTMYFQREADDWNTNGMRWWATFARVSPIQPGEFELDVPLNAEWTSVFAGMSATTDPDKFATAKQKAERVGFTFGGGDGYGHGITVTGPARFVVTSFRIE